MTRKLGLSSDIPFKYVKVQTYESICEYTNYFLDDVYNVAYQTSVLLAGDGNVKETTTYSAYVMEDEKGRFPNRFVSYENEIAGIQEDMRDAKVKANAMLQETTAETYYPPLTIENMETAVSAFDCDPENCPCIEAKDDVAHEGVNFPNILVSTTEMFVKKVKNDITKRGVVGKVQLIFTDPYTYTENQAQLKAEDIGLIVMACSDLLQEGGHVFIKTTLQHSSSIAMAFKKAKGGADQEIFTVDEAPFHLMASPQDKRGHIGTDGSTATRITLMYIHAMKLGAMTKEEAHERAKTRNYGETNSRYHFFAEESWIAMACISLKQSRFYVGATTTEEKKNDLDEKLAECPIYQSGQTHMTSGMGFRSALLQRMKEVYNSHNFEERYNPIYGIGTWIETGAAVGSSPRLTTIPDYLLDHICVLRSDPTFASRVIKRKSPNDMGRDIGRTLMCMNAGESLRCALTQNRLYMDNSSPYTKEGLRMGHNGDKGDKLGTTFGIVINGGWEENRKVLKELGRGLFENDEYVVDNVDLELDDLKFIPSKFCPYRYATFRKTGGNARIRINEGKGIRRKELYQHQKYEVILIEKAIIGEAIIINTTVRRESGRRESIE